ncbi:hypothetical protein [Spirilliplanes yamanashiensis]|nr:hypothetical protein [Spirilliplanes yamanashiensis]MDP9818487.1 hypothetical protein [Spirilliplanes yamanashiensis]
MTRMKGSRHAALRKAQQMKQERDARRLRRERQVEAALADFYEHGAAAAAIVEQAQQRAARILDDAERVAASERALAAVAVRTLAELGEQRSAIAELTGLSITAVREALAAAGEPRAVEAVSATVAPPENDGPDAIGWSYADVWRSDDQVDTPMEAPEPAAAVVGSDGWAGLPVWDRSAEDPWPR